MRSGASSSPSASWISCRARLRVVRSLARRVLCRASDSAALRATVSSSAFLGPRSGHPEPDRPAAAFRQPFLDRRRVRREFRYQHLARNGRGPGGRAGVSLLPHGPAPRRLLGAVRDLRARRRAGHRVVAVDLAQELLDQLARGHVLDLVHHPAALPADPAVPHVEDLDRGFQLVLGERDDVAVGAVAQDHGLLLQGPLQRLDVVAQPRGPLELLGPGGLAHLGFQAADEPVGLPGHEVAEFLGEQPVLGLADPAHARRRALADVAEQAGPPDLPGPLEHPGRAGADREHPQQRVDRFANCPRVRVGPEITNPAPLGAAHDHDPRESPHPW